MQQAEPFRFEIGREHGNTGGVSAGPVQACDQPRFNRVIAARKDDRDRRRCRLGRKRGRLGTDRYENRYPAPDEFCRQFRQSVVFAACPTEFDATFLPSIRPPSSKPFRKAVITPTESSGDRLLMKPITGKAVFCARATDSQTKAEPETNLIKSRRLMQPTMVGQRYSQLKLAHCKGLSLDQPTSVQGQKLP
jgi:hypothetical protein